MPKINLVLSFIVFCLSLFFISSLVQADLNKGLVAGWTFDKDEIKDAVENLPTQYREVVLLADVQGFSYKEIAEILDVPDGTVMSRLHRARAKLKDLLFDSMTSRRLIYQYTKDISAELETVGGASSE